MNSRSLGVTLGQFFLQLLGLLWDLNVITRIDHSHRYIAISGCCYSYLVCRLFMSLWMEQLVVIVSTGARSYWTCNRRFGTVVYLWNQRSIGRLWNLMGSKVSLRTAIVVILVLLLIVVGVLYDGVDQLVIATRKHHLRSKCLLLSLWI